MKQIIKIPSEVIYVNEMTNTLPSGILSKGKTGVGVTSLALTNHENYIIAVPFIALIENKLEQYPKDSILGIYSKICLESEIKNYLKKPLQPKKFLVTYDSLPYLLDVLGSKVCEYKLLIDEYHLLFLQYSFRKQAIKGVLDNYSRCKDATFVSATPLEEEFILNELRDLPHTEYVWERETTVKVISVKCRKGVISTVINLIERFLDGEIEGNAYFFINSVSLIKDIIDLTVPLNSNNCRAIYSKNNPTKISIKRGSVSDEPRLINFVTSCCFEGCDIYDPDGKIYVVSDGKKSTTLVDISTSFQQIVGRIRNTKYWDTIHHIFTETRYYGISSYQDFVQISNQEIVEGNALQKTVNTLPEFMRNKLDTSCPYVLKDKNLQFNFDSNLVRLDLFNYKLTSCIYNLQANVQKELEKYSYNVQLDLDRAESEVIIADLLADNFRDVVQQLKEFYPPNGKPILRDQLDLQYTAFRRYPYLKVVIDVLGYDYIESQNYKTDKVKRKSRQLIPLSVDELIMEELRDNFFIQFRGTMSNNELVCLLDDIYKSLDICLKAKANHIEKYYHAKKTTYWDKSLKKRVNGYNLIKPKLKGKNLF